MADIDRTVYYYVIEISVMLMQRYKMNPFLFGDTVTIADLQSYTEILLKKEEEEQNSLNKNDIWSGLMQIRDILNTISFKK